MSTSDLLTGAINAANAQTQASKALTDEVSGKIAAFDASLGEMKTDFEYYKDTADLIGPPNGYGTTRQSVFQGMVIRTRSGTAWAVGDFESTDLGTETNIYLHFKTPLSINEHNEMFLFTIQGYSFGSSQILNDTITGYCFSETNEIKNVAAFGDASPTCYADNKGNVVLRIMLPNIYYTTLRIDTMRVGNGRLFNKGDLQAIQSTLDRVTF